MYRMQGTQTMYQSQESRRRRPLSAAAARWGALVCVLACCATALATIPNSDITVPPDPLGASTPQAAATDSPTPPAGEPIDTPTSAPTTQSLDLPDPLPAVSDLNDIDLFQLKIPTVVSASRHEQTVATLPYAVSVITAEEIRLSGAASVPDALRLVPGMDVAAMSSGTWSVSPRGLPSMIAAETLILVDGRQIFDSLFGGTYWGGWPFQLEDIDHIEVIRGPGGVTWGANAVSGVINIITKDPKNQKGLTTVTMGGSRGSFKQYQGYGYVGEKLRVRVSGEYEANDGFREGGSFLRPLADYAKTGRETVYAIYDANPNDTLTLSAGSAQTKGLVAPTLAYGLWPEDPNNQGSYFMSKWGHKVAQDNQYEWTFYVNDFHLSTGLPAMDYRYQQFALQFSHTLKPAKDHTLTYGMDSRIDRIDTTNGNPFLLAKDVTSSGIFGFYVQDEFNFAPRWALNLGARLDYDTYGGIQPSGRAALSYQLTKDSFLYGSVSRSFHMPAVGMRFLEIPLMHGLGRLRGHSDLDAQPLIAYETGYRARWFDNRLQTDAALFWHEFSDLDGMVARLGPPGLLVLDNDNRADASIYGLELETKYIISKPLMLQANYTYESIDWRAPRGIHMSEGMSPPRHKFMIGPRYTPIPRLHLWSQLFFVDSATAPHSDLILIPRRIPAYFRLDLRAEYEIWKDHASLAVGVRNLLDRDHYEGGSLFTEGAQVPRMVYAELRMTFR